MYYGLLKEISKLDVETKTIFYTSAETISNFVFLPNGMFAAIINETIEIRDPNSEKLISNLSTTEQSKTIVVLPNGHIAIGTLFGSVEIWDVKKRRK